MKIPSHPLLYVAILLASCPLAIAANYPTLSIPLALNVPKFNALSASFPTSKGSVSLGLQFAYTGNNNFNCADGSVVDGLVARCTGVQTGSNYTLKINGADGTRITFKGKVPGTSVSPTYKGPKGKLALRKVSVTPEVSGLPVDSEIILKPATTAKGSLAGSKAQIKSGYAGVLAEVPLTGSVKKGVVHWSLKGSGNSLSFTGKEKNGNWIGKITGNIGPAKVSVTKTIPLVEAVSGSDAHFYGSVSTSDGSSQPAKASKVKVTIRSDLNNNGSFDGAESVSVITGDTGSFDQKFGVVAGQPVMVDFELDDYSKTPKMYASVTPGSEIPINTTLRKLEALALANGDANSADGKLQLENLPSTVKSLTGKVFNPVTETSQFPGEFADDKGNMLISSVFSAVEAKDANGNPVTDLASATKIKMQVPKDTWVTLGDLTANNNKIDVPLYYYDEKSGEWKRSTSDGWLEDESGAVLTEATLNTLKTGAFASNVFAVGNITHLSYWNIDWPIETHGCVAGRIVDSLGNPVPDAVITASGTTYTGTSSPRTTSANGRFCLEVMRSEASGEDLNNNGVRGEASSVALTAYANGKYYKLGVHTVPVIPATCSTSGCLELGDIKLEAALEVVSTICTITGNVVYSGSSPVGSSTLPAGTPLSNSFVFGYDSSMEAGLPSCYLDGSCLLFGSTDNLGNFTLRVPILFGAEIWAYSFDANFSAYYLGTKSVQGCPTTPLSIGADYYGNVFNTD